MTVPRHRRACQPKPESWWGSPATPGSWRSAGVMGISPECVLTSRKRLLNQMAEICETILVVVRFMNVSVRITARNRQISDITKRRRKPIIESGRPVEKQPNFGAFGTVMGSGVWRRSSLFGVKARVIKSINLDSCYRISRQLKYSLVT